MSDAMRPSSDWSADADQFASASGRQSILCVTCHQTATPESTPPALILMIGGFSVCIEHFDGMRQYLIQQGKL